MGGFLELGSIEHHVLANVDGCLGWGNFIVQTGQGKTSSESKQVSVLNA